MISFIFLTIFKILNTKSFSLTIKNIANIFITFLIKNLTFTNCSSIIPDCYQSLTSLFIKIFSLSMINISFHTSKIIITVFKIYSNSISNWCWNIFSCKILEYVSLLSKYFCFIFHYFWLSFIFINIVCSRCLNNRGNIWKSYFFIIFPSFINFLNFKFIYLSHLWLRAFRWWWT